jgi:hypothetical protein
MLTNQKHFITNRPGRDLTRDDSMANESEQSGLTFPDAYVKGTLLLHRGDLEGARRSFETAREEVQGSKAPRLVTAVLGNLGNVYAALNERGSSLLLTHVLYSNPFDALLMLDKDFMLTVHRRQIHDKYRRAL